MEKIRLHKFEAVSGNIENPEKKLERLEASLQKSFQESQGNGGVAGPEVDDLKTEWLDCLLENPDMLSLILARTQETHDPFEKQLYALASQGPDILKAQSMLGA